MQRIATLLLTVVMLSACAMLAEKDKQQALSEATLHYEKAIRWGDFPAADNQRRLADHSPRSTANLQRIKVTSYRQVNSRPLPDDTGIVITVKIDYYYDDTLKVATITDKQVWKYDEDGKTWHIITPLPAFR